jgi:hypothetical protein
MMPTISMFYGIIIRMYFAPGEHPPPHFHVYYVEYTATVNIKTCEIIDGKRPKKQRQLVLAWAELHQEELMADWNLVMNGEARSSRPRELPPQPLTEPDVRLSPQQFPPPEKHDKNGSNVTKT